MTLWVAVACYVVALTPEKIRAQAAATDPVAFFAGTTILATIQPAPDGPPDGTTEGRGAAIAVTAGALLTRHVTLEGEVVIPWFFENTRSGRYFQVASRHRDVTLSMLAGAQWMRGRRAQPKLVGGMSALRSETRMITSWYDFRPGATAFLRPPGPEIRVSDWHIALTGGAELRQLVTRNLFVVPQLRVHWTPRGGFSDNWNRGLGKWIVRPGVAVQLQF